MSRATETSGPIGVIIDIDRSRLADGVVIVALSGDLNVLSVPRIRAALADFVGNVDVVIDLSAVESCEAAMLRVLVDVQRRSAGAGRTLLITDPSEPVRALFEVSGLRGVLRVTSSH